MRSNGSDHRATEITAAIVSKIEAMLSDGTAVEVIATRLRVPETLIELIREDRSRPPVPRPPPPLRTKPAKPPCEWRTGSTPIGPLLEEGEELADVPIRCPGCGALLVILPCRLCRMRAETLDTKLREAAKERQKLSEGRGAKKGVANSPHLNDQGKTRDKLGEQFGVSGNGRENERRRAKRPPS